MFSLCLRCFETAGKASGRASCFCEIFRQQSLPVQVFLYFCVWTLLGQISSRTGQSGGISEGRVSMERDKQIADLVVDVCVCVTLDLGCRG